MIDGNPKTTAVRKSMFPMRIWLKEPTKLVSPTMNSEYAVDKTGSIWNRYTNMGTVSMDPPPPISPSESPIKMAPIYPMISMLGLFR